ncbi:MAG: DNA-binding response regulator [Bacteroidetes bacterium GWA2_30_7]|nr:MAG: DNA-binding response regulator [Bacteroidetes bacterium GWA2_30_7]
MKILLVEDDTKISAFVKLGLEENDYYVTVAYDSATAEKLIFNKEFDIIILDIIIPGINGLELCKKIRNGNVKIPIIMLSSLDSVEDKIEGFNCGADDYLIKPFSFKELHARIKALGRRHTETIISPSLKLADLEIDTITKKVNRNKKDIKLTAKEFSILELLISNTGKVFDRIEIAEKIWGFSFNSNTNVIDVHINSIRNKIDKDFSPTLLHTIVGFGYVMKIED